MQYLRIAIEDVIFGMKKHCKDNIFFLSLLQFLGCGRYGWLYISCLDEFVRIGEMPGGRGYADSVFLPKRGSSMPVMVIELKWNKTAKSAIEQIKNKNYPETLKNYGGDILMVGINYDPKTQKHTCRIEEFTK